MLTLRNFGILAHVDAGKTTLSERMLFLTGAIHKKGEVHHGTATLDSTDEERRHGITISAAATTTRWTPRFGRSAGQAHTLSLIDTPGHVDFTAEVERSVRVLDGAVVVLDATQGVEPQTENVWQRASQYGVPRLVFVNKMDLAGANFARCVEELEARFGVKALAVQWPVGAEHDFVGMVDLVHRTGWAFQADGVETALTHTAELETQVEAARARLVESVAEVSDEVLKHFVEVGAAAVPARVLEAGLREATVSGRGVPVLCGAALKDKGVQALLDAVVAYLPSPLDRPAAVGQLLQSGEPTEVPRDERGSLCALVFKSVAAHVGTLSWVRVYRGTLRAGLGLEVVRGKAVVGRERVGRLVRVEVERLIDVDELRAGQLGAVLGPRQVRTGDTLCVGQLLALEAMRFPEPLVELSIEAASAEDEAKVAAALVKAQVEDPTLTVKSDPETGQTLLRGLGELHLALWVERLGRQFQVAVRTGAPKVAYRETPKKSARARYRHVRQSGGPGQFAVVELEVAPLGRGEGVCFVDLTRGGVLAAEFVKAVEAGVRGALLSGPGGYPVVDVEVQLLDGQVHEVDSSALAFEVAGSLATKQALGEAGVQRLGPVMEVDITTPEAFVGNVLGDVAARRGQVESLSPRGDGRVLVRAVVALERVFGFVDSTRSRTGGRGAVAMKLRGYQ